MKLNNQQTPLLPTPPKNHQRQTHLAATQSAPLTPAHHFRPLIIIIKDLIRIQQNRLHHAGLEPRVADIRPRRGAGAHERRAKYDGEVLRAHAVGAGIVHDAVQVQRQGAQRGVVGVGQAVDDGVQRIAADGFVFVF